tara:strand:+ start:340 stop:531 length:192 start_codon:yes stop_codon:yes gene_type:complete
MITLPACPLEIPPLVEVRTSSASLTPITGTGFLGRVKEPASRRPIDEMMTDSERTNAWGHAND